MQKMCLNCEYFKQEEEHIQNELTLGRCMHKEMSHLFHVEKFIPGTVICCIYFKVKPGLVDDAAVPVNNESRSRGARKVMAALEKKNPSLKRENDDRQ